MTLRAVIIVLAMTLPAMARDIGFQRAPSVSPVVVKTYPHDPSAFTQGLTLDDGWLYEGTGGYGRSSIRRIDLESGQVAQIATLDRAYFGEGIAILGDRLYQLTWQKGIVFVYDMKSFRLVTRFHYTGEGWGLTTDGELLIVSDGSNELRYFEPGGFTVVRTVTVTDGGAPVVRLNELEYIDGEIWANVWGEERIARIDPGSGRVLAWLDLSGLHPRGRRGMDDVLNGIAYDAAANRVFVTGKRWPRLFELRVDP